VSSFLTAHQHILGYLVPYNSEKVKKNSRITVITIVYHTGTASSYKNE